MERVDMRYNFSSMEEPSDEQLQQLMFEVGEEVRASSKRVEEIVAKQLSDAFQRAKSQAHG